MALNHSHQALRTDGRQYLIYDAETCSAVLRALEASAVYMYGKWLESIAGGLPTPVKSSVGTIGSVLKQMADARMEINSETTKNPERYNEVPRELVMAQRNLDLFARWVNDRNSVPYDQVVAAMDEVAGAIQYIHQRTMELPTGTDHPRWTAREVSGVPCKTCGR